MNNPADAVANLLLLSHETDRQRAAAVVAGALIPNLVFIACYAWDMLQGTPETVVSSVEYYRPFRQGLIDGCNSFPLLRRWIAALRSIIYLLYWSYVSLVRMQARGGVGRRWLQRVIVKHYAGEDQCADPMIVQKGDKAVCRSAVGDQELLVAEQQRAGAEAEVICPRHAEVEADQQ